MGFSDLHIHTTYSYDGTATVPAVLKYVADNTDLDVIAITDHDSMAGIPEAQALASRYGLKVIPGEEITTAEGHLIALYLNRPIQAGLSYLETVYRVKAQGGVCIAAHPTARGTSSVTFETLKRVLQNQDALGGLVGVEAFNAGLVYTRSNETVAEACRALPLSQVASSDAHILKMIAHGSTEFEGRSIYDLRRALLARETHIRCSTQLGGMEVLRDYIPHILLRKLGWADWNASPESPISLARLSRTADLAEALLTD